MDSLRDTLSIIFNKLKKTQICWYVTGRTSLNLQGINIQPKYIGIQIYDHDLPKFIEVFKKFKMTKPIELSNQEALEFNIYINNLIVLVCAEHSNGTYLSVPQKINQVDIKNGIKVPCLDLKSEMQAYEKLKMFDRSELIKNYLKQKT